MIRIGVTADIHASTDDGSDAPNGLFAALDGVDSIVACGDHTGEGVLARLAALAPVTATANPRMPGDGGGLAQGTTATFEADGVRFGVVFSLLTAGIDVDNEGAIAWPASGTADRLRGLFDNPADVVLFGGTHVPYVGSVDGLLLVNPGSPKFAARRTAAVVTVDNAVASVEIVDCD